MDSHEKELLVARLKCGYLRFNSLKVVPFSDDLLYEAEELYAEIFQDSLMEGVLCNNEVLFFLQQRGLFTKEMLDELYELEKLVDDLKVQVYESFYQSAKKHKISQELEKTRKRLDFLRGRRNSWESATAEGIASYAKWQHLIEFATLTKDGRPYNFRCEEAEHTIAEVLSYYQSNLIPEKKMREIARTEPWNTQWALLKKLHKFLPYPLSIDQQNLILWSSLYDSISESPEAPSKAVIEDDDSLDGWLISQRKDNGKTPVNSDKKRYEEVFMMCDTPEDAKRILQMNDGYAKSVVEERAKKVQEEGSVKLHEFADVQQKRKRLEQGGKP